ASVSSIARFVYSCLLAQTTDYTYYTWLVGIWTIPELSFAIVVACLPVSGKFVQAIKASKVFSHLSSLSGSRLRLGSSGKLNSTTINGHNHWKDSSSTQRGRVWPTSNYPHLLDADEKINNATTIGHGNGVENTIGGTRPSREDGSNRIFVMREVDIAETV
ncbi:MAG: hypothetical protein Q9157_005481, partial [Trypethelium eluteriae]